MDFFPLRIGDDRFASLIGSFRSIWQTPIDVLNPHPNGPQGRFEAIDRDCVDHGEYASDNLKESHRFPSFGAVAIPRNTRPANSSQGAY
jgi:hypothetical protein